MGQIGLGCARTRIRVCADVERRDPRGPAALVYSRTVSGPVHANHSCQGRLREEQVRHVTRAAMGLVVMIISHSAISRMIPYVMLLICRHYRVVYYGSRHGHWQFRYIINRRKRERYYCHFDAA